MDVQMLYTQIRLFIILFASLVLARVSMYIVRLSIEHFMKDMNHEQLQRVKNAARFTILYTTVLLGLYIILTEILSGDMGYYVRGSIFTAMILIVAFGIKRILSTTVEFTISHASKRGLIGLSRDMTNVINNLIDIVIVAVSILAIFAVWGVSIGPFITSMGIVGAAVAFAAQATISNFFSGLIIFFDKRIRVGDYVEFKGISGVVEEIRTMSTRIRTWDNTLVTVPNSDIVNNPVEDRHLPKIKKKIKIKFSFVYGTNIEKAKKVIIDTVKKIKKVSKDPAPSVYLVELGDYSVKLMLIAYVDSVEDVWSTKCEINEKVYNACRKAKLEFAFPTQTIKLKNYKSKK